MKKPTKVFLKLIPIISLIIFFQLSASAQEKEKDKTVIDTTGGRIKKRRWM